MINWGIIGCGGIAHKMADTIGANPDCRLCAAAAREQKRADAFAAQYHAEQAYGNYQALAEDSQVDAVYVATIHPTHYDAVKLCLEHGKPVLCEKPLTMTLAQAEELFRLAGKKNRLLMEAIWTRILPAWQEIKHRVEAGEIGKLLTVIADLTFQVDFDPESRMYNLEKGGGSLLDLGVYPLHAALFMLGNGYQELQAAGRLSPTGSDVYSAITLQYPGGQIAHAYCGMDCQGDKCVRLMGEKGFIVLPDILSADEYTIYKNGQSPEHVSLPYKRGFSFELTEFTRLMKEGKTHSDIATPEATLAVMKAVEAGLQTIGYRYADE